MPAMMCVCRLVLLSSLALPAIGAICSSPGGAAEPEGNRPSPEQIEFFERKIRPVLVEHCYACHSAAAKELQGELLLDRREGLLRGGGRGPAMVPGDPKASLLLKALRHDELQMPPEVKLPDNVISDFETWIKSGAADPRDEPAPTSTSRMDIAAARKKWAFQPPQVHDLPAVRDPSWPRERIDWFVLARIEQAGLAPAQSADRATWIRRLTYDLVGLPPDPDDVQAFLDDASADAEQRVVERLLASPHFGERWARLWLDVARFAEDQAHIVGEDKSLFYPNAYLYRDWVVRAFNDDLPYDEFVRLQLAADLLRPDDLAAQPALGFLGLGPKYYGRKSQAVMADEWEDRVDTVCRGLLGLTAACARCHDHKFDPIRTHDYYALAGVFASTEMFNRPLDTKRGVKEDGQTKDPADAMHVVREGEPKNLNVFVRGNVENLGPLVPRRFLEVLCATEPAPFQEGSGRRELALAITSPSNPLAARVIVNRIWAALFGRGLVATPSNFGALGDPPTHPELLDDLAARFVASGWSLKRLLRELVLSATYAQASTLSNDPAKGSGHDVVAAANDASTAHDGAPLDVLALDRDQLFARMPRRRLSVEAWRDTLLAAAGRLEATIGGPSIDPADPQERRRTLYSRISRLELNRLLALFDYPDPNIHADRRVETTTPLQKMFVLNSPFLVENAAALAHRLLAEIPPGEGAHVRRIARAYHWLFGRPATEIETRLALDYLQEADDQERAWRQYAHVLLAANELWFID
jgi:hypothetical protein